MKVIKTKLSEVKLNPNNPRLIKDDNFKKLVQSIKDFPEMLDIRPIVVNADMVILGGNMRYKACKEAGLKDVPIIIADNLTEEQQREFLIKDNVSGGEWDFEVLGNEWNVDELTDWGLEIPIFMDEPSYEDLIGKEKNKPASMKITFKTVEQLQEAENDIQELIDRKYNGAYFSVSAGEI
jgi:ParB-like chromosome segregation protein Spo0J